MDTTSKKHPDSLIIFCGTELWERYGFYAVQSLLALYLSKVFRWPDDQIYQLVGTFTALTYLSPIIGGWIADQLIGQKYAVILSSFTLAVSYFLLSNHDSPSTLSISLALIAVGTGLMKPNISAMLGHEYHYDSPFRERGFTLFYMGITVGIILGTTVPSLLSEYYSWSAAFFSGCIGMIIALTLFVSGSFIFRFDKVQTTQISLPKTLFAGVILILSGLVFWFILSTPSLAAATFAVIFGGSIIYLMKSIRTDGPEQAKLTLIICCLCCISILFWAFYFQMFTSLTLFIERLVQPKLYGFDFPPPFYVSIQSIGMLLFGMVLSRNTKKLSITDSAKRTNTKFLLAMICMSLAYIFITAVCYVSLGNFSKINALLIIPAYLLISVAELLLSPVGLAAITTLASRSRVSTMMGIFFVSLGLGGYLSGVLAKFTSIRYSSMDSLNELKLHYLVTFNDLTVIIFLAAFISFIFYKIIGRIIATLDD